MTQANFDLIREAELDDERRERYQREYDEDHAQDDDDMTEERDHDALRGQGY